MQTKGNSFTIHKMDDYIDELQFTVEYREGKTNKTADALSRVPRQEEAVFYSLEVSMAYVLSNINSEIKKGSTTDKITQ